MPLYKTHSFDTCEDFHLTHSCPESKRRLSDQCFSNIRYIIAVRVFNKIKAPFEAGFGPANDDYESSAVTTWLFVVAVGAFSRCSLSAKPSLQLKERRVIIDFLVAVCIFCRQGTSFNGQCPPAPRISGPFLIIRMIAVSTFDKKQLFVICILHPYYTVHAPVFHGKKVANSLEFAAFLRN